ncbi:uncharacterized protein LOC125189954 [Salvia hispanica]|uniref:uncharacterized protein LOC125189954 n=1 Tax=Salvia hispanica TaxID=49212 RepID=UPI00200930F8|nr:uncharacterized protein LOC125189954 [Salvia hispanica]
MAAAPCGGAAQRRAVEERAERERRSVMGDAHRNDSGGAKLIGTAMALLVRSMNPEQQQQRLREARINNLEQGINTISTVISNINTQMEQVQKKLDEDKAKVAARVEDINKKWVAKQKSGDCPVACGPPQPPQRTVADLPIVVCPAAGGPAHTPRRAATNKEESSTKQVLVQNNEIEITKYAKLLTEAVMRKKKPIKADLKLLHHCSEIFQKERAVKQRDPEQFIIRCRIGEGKVDKALCDLGSSINLMPLKYYEKLNIGPLKTSDVTLRLADNSSIKTVGMIEDVLVKVDDFIFPADFIVLDMKMDKNVSLILGRDFLATCKALIYVGRGEITISDNYSRSTYKIETRYLNLRRQSRQRWNGSAGQSWSRLDKAS